MSLAPMPASAEPVGSYYPCPDGKMRPRVTAVEKLIGLGTDALAGWAARTEKAATLEAVRECHSYAQGMTPEAFVATVEKHIGSAKAHLRKLQSAADIGSIVHKQIEQYMAALIAGDVYEMTSGNAQALWAIMAFQDWWAEENLTPVLSEQKVWCPELDTAGTIDLICRRADGVMGIVDFKTSNYLLPIHHVQVATYLEMGKHFWPLEWAKLVRIPKTYGEVAIEVRDLGEVWDDRAKKHRRIEPEALVRSFKAARELYRVFMETD